jgi:hypothetical protein
VSAKQEQTSKHNYHFHAWNVGDQSCLEIRSTWDTSSHSAKAEALQNMERLIARVIAELEENLDEQS